MYKITLEKSIRKPKKGSDPEAIIDWESGYKTAKIDAVISKDEAITVSSYIQNRVAENEEKAYNMATKLLDGTPGQKKFGRMVLHNQFGEGDNLPEYDSGSELQTRGVHKS